MAELGFHRTSKKCKEKFENVFKYHKRTKEGRASKADGKTYRFFDQLEALEGNPAALQLPPTPTPRAPPQIAGAPPPSSIPPNITVSSAPLSPNPVSFAQNLVSGQNQNNPSSNMNPQPIPATAAAPPAAHHQYSMAGMMMSNSSSSSTSSDEEIDRRRGRKRKWKDFFERLMKDVINKQEELQRRFLESLEKRERDRMVREEAWRSQELARMTREHDLLVQERSMAAAKDAAVIAFLQKVTDQQNPNPNPTAAPIHIPPPPPPITIPTLSTPPPPPPPQQPPQAPPPTIPSLPMPVIPAPAPAPAPLQTPPQPQPRASADMSITPKPGSDNGIQSFLQPSPSRWPKSEVQALIKLRTNLDMKYQENGPKGPLWEEISAGMRKMGYNRNAKRCKEKWENINKYFKKVKESNKKRPQDSKTCPYFHQLEALYREKGAHSSAYTPPAALPPPPATAPPLPIMARPEQQWPIVQAPPQQPPHHHQHQDSMEEDDRESDNMDEDDHDDDGDDEDDDDEGGGDYEMVTNKQQQQPPAVATSAAE